MTEIYNRKFIFPSREHSFLKTKSVSPIDIIKEKYEVFEKHNKLYITYFSINLQ